MHILFHVNYVCVKFTQFSTRTSRANLNLDLRKKFHIWPARNDIESLNEFEGMLLKKKEEVVKLEEYQKTTFDHIKSFIDCLWVKMGWGFNKNSKKTIIRQRRRLIIEIKSHHENNVAGRNSKIGYWLAFTNCGNHLSPFLINKFRFHSNKKAIIKFIRKSK